MERRAIWANRYAIFDEVGAGGMASLFLAGRLGQVGGRRVVALKKLFEQFAKQPEFVAMFLDEARLAARVRHPNVVRTYQVLRVPDSLAIVMEFVVGVSFAELLQRSRKAASEPPLLVAGAIVAGALEGLHAAHEACDETGAPFGLVHRDVSPHNILVGRDGVPRVIDFGIAKAAGRLQVTEAGVMKGKYAYMAPEQIRGGMIDRRTDVYAAGIVLWEALTGHRLFGGSADLDLLGKRAVGEILPGPPSALNPGVPRSVDAVVYRALQIDQDKRFATTKEMASALTSSLGCASSADVAHWVTSLAGERIAELQGKVQELERAFDAGELESADDLTARRPSSERAAPPSVIFEMPDLEYAGLAPRSSHPRMAPSSPPSRPASSRPPQERGGTASFDDELRLDVARSGAVVSRTAPPLRAPSQRPAQPASEANPTTWLDWMSSTAGRVRGAEGGATRVVLLAMAGALLLVGAMVAEWPALLESMVTRGAARWGVVLSVERVRLGSGGLRLIGAAARLTESDDITLQAPEIDVVMDWTGSVDRVVAHGFDLRLQGSAPRAASRFAAWRAAPSFHPSIDAREGRMVWSDAVLPGSLLEATDVTAETWVDDEQHLRVDAGALAFVVGGERLGPWVAHLESTSAETKLHVQFDKTVTEGPPNFSLLVRPSLGEMFSLELPRSRLAMLGVPPRMFGVGSDAEIELRVEGQVFPTGEPVNARMRLALFGATVPSVVGNGAPTDVVFEGKIGGSPAEAIPLTDATITVQDASSPVKGKVTLDHGEMRVEIDRPRTSGPVRPLVVLDIGRLVGLSAPAPR